MPAARNRKRRPWPQRLLLGCAGVIAAAIAGEGLVRIVHGPQVRFSRRVVEAPWGIRPNEPYASYSHTLPDVNITFRINAQGMRSNVDFDYAKPAGRRRIICLGDSFTIGYEVENEQCFARRLERMLLERGLDVEVLNAGVSGFSNAESLLSFERELQRYAPDVVVLSFFLNDLATTSGPTCSAWWTARWSRPMTATSRSAGLATSSTPTRSSTSCWSTPTPSCW